MTSKASPAPDPNLDRARHGVCRDNVVGNITAYGNPTLASWRPFLTNSNAPGLLEITNPVTVAMRFFPARMAE